MERLNGLREREFSSDSWRERRILKKIVREKRLKKNTGEKS